MMLLTGLSSIILTTVAAAMLRDNLHIFSNAMAINNDPYSNYDHQQVYNSYSGNFEADPNEYGEDPYVTEQLLEKDNSYDPYRLPTEYKDEKFTNSLSEDYSNDINFSLLVIGIVTQKQRRQLRKLQNYNLNLF